MASVLFLATSEAKRDLVRGWLREAGVQAEVSSDVAGLSTMTKGNAPEVLAVDAPSLGGAGVETALNTAKSLGVPGFALLGVDDLDNHRLLAQLADFTLEPARPLEFIARLLRLLRQNNGDESRQVVRVGDLVIDAERYEVRVAGEIKLLTYKEYELLRLLASSPGRVFTREELLS
ncbi:MAG: response regulator transcription factor, partial [SAR202 cluster bacterium]|nr:response regulator transcription factor [SAR202 cluster bacterium]